VDHPANSQYRDVIRDYYLYLDDEVGSILEMLDDDTAVLVVSDHGAQRLDGGFCVNEWLVREGFLVLDQYPREVTLFSKLPVNWEKTRVWSEGGYYARVFFNVKGREPNGVIDPGDYERFRDEMKLKFEALADPAGKNMGNLVYRPEEVYRTVRNVAPDLIVHFGGLHWRSIGGVGYTSLHIRENDTGPDDCNHSQFGSFVLAAPSGALSGEVQGAHLLNIAPTLLELGGYDVPGSMQGTPLRQIATGKAAAAGFSATQEAIIRERLSGLGYIS
jgi:predicted AlkP superfamily phosphohydrolase/phosphomutase